MILTGRDIQWYIVQGKLVITPCLESQFQQNGIDLVLKHIERQNLLFILGETQEWIEVPDDLMAFVELRSTWARKGLFLPPTIVDAGFKGSLTLEILDATNSAKTAVGKRFAHLIFAKCTGPCQPYRGKYQNQTGITYAKEGDLNEK